MIQSRTKVTHPEHGNGVVIKVFPHSQKAKVAFGLSAFTCWMSDLTICKNKYTYKKSEEQVLEEVLLEISKIRGEYCTGDNNHAEGGRIVLDKLTEKLRKWKD